MSITKEFLKRLLPLFAKKYIASFLCLIEFNRHKDLIAKNKEFKGVGKGKRVFILGSGNSILNLDLSLLSSENVIVLNNGCVIDGYKNFMSGTGIKVHLVAPIHPPQTDQEWFAWFKQLEANVPLSCSLFFGLGPYRRNALRIIREESIFRQHKLNWFFVGRDLSIWNPPRNIFKGVDLSGIIYSGEAASIYGLILAEYMQFDEVVMLGMDHDYFLYDDESSMRIYSSAEHQKNELLRTFNGDFYIEEFFRQYKIFKKYSVLSKAFRAKIYSCSGPILRIFPRRKYSDFFD